MDVVIKTEEADQGRDDEATARREFADHGGTAGAGLEGLPGESLEAQRQREEILKHGTKAVAVSSNKQLTSKFRGVCWNKKNKVWLSLPCEGRWQGIS